MSIETPEASSPDASDGPSERWEVLLPRLRQLDDGTIVKKVFGPASRRGAIYRWGVSASTGMACNPLLNSLSRLACQDGKPQLSSVDLDLEAASFIDLVDRITNYNPQDALAANVWASALPALSTRIEPHRWWRLLDSLKQLHASILQRSTPYSRSHLMLGGELGLTLAWRLPVIGSCGSLAKPGCQAVKDWANCEEDAVTASLATPQDARLVLASLLRCRALIEIFSNRKFGKKQRAAGARLATWVVAMTHTGGTAFSGASAQDLKDDYAKGSLIDCAIEFDRDSLKPAFAAAVGKPHGKGRLVWEIDLPETIHHDPQAQIAVGFPQWDVRRGRFHLNYSSDQMEVELFAGRRRVLRGSSQLRVELDDIEQHSQGEWEEVCQYSDDDVHYLELEQTWSGGIHVQRQILSLRDDRCVLIADAILPNPGCDLTDVAINYASSYALDPGVELVPETETREAFLRDGKRRGLVIPLAASEWNVGPTNSTLVQTNDQHMQLVTRAHGALYAPLWFDFQQRRFDRNRTWRQLTVGDQLRLVGRDESVGYRIQSGSEQWMVYRSLGQRCCRTVLGKHLIADFYCSRFDPSDGSHDELLTVDDREND